MQKQRHAITSVELVAVVTTVVLVLGVLAPVLASGRRQSKKSVCLYNLARIAQASVTYTSTDPDENAIPVHPGVANAAAPSIGRRAIAHYGWGGKSGQGEYLSSTDFWGTAAGRGPATRPLNPVVYGHEFPDYAHKPGPDFVNWRRDAELDLPVYRCPSDSGYAGIHYLDWRDGGRSSYDEYGTSYGANVMWIFYVGGGFCESNSPFARRLTEIVDPVHTILYQENCGLFAYRACPQGSPGQECDLGSGDTSTVRGWHGRPWWFNAAFVDGHADTIHMRGYDNPRLGRYPYCDPDDPEASFGIWKCVIIRGRNWQKDTLPLVPAPTDIWCGGKGCGQEDAEEDTRGAVRQVVPDIG